MAYYRKLPSGLWQATVRGRDGKRHTKTDKLKTVVKQWATEQEAAIARGEFRDPRLGDLKVGDWYQRVAAARATDPATKANTPACGPPTASLNGLAGRCPRSPGWKPRSGPTASK